MYVVLCVCVCVCVCVCPLFGFVTDNVTLCHSVPDQNGGGVPGDSMDSVLSETVYREQFACSVTYCGIVYAHALVKHCHSCLLVFLSVRKVCYCLPKVREQKSCREREEHTRRAWPGSGDD